MMSDLTETKRFLDSVSSCFCMAKWSTVTLHLETGTAHSCHHPKVHDIPLEPLKNNPSALHNTAFKIEQREKMMRGERPSECGYCWNVEDLNKGEISDRIIKSSEEHCVAQYEQVIQNPLNKNFIPKYVEVSFSNTCQFKCSYCSSNFSSTWQDELNKFGNYHNHHGISTSTVHDESENPYIKAFWQWWPELKPELKTFRITGGEPLLSPNTFLVLDSLIAEPAPDMNLSINSNLGAPPVLVEKFIESAKEIMNRKAVKSMYLYTSIDAWGSRAEYIRNGLKHEYFWNNVEKILSSIPEIQIIIMCTFNALSVSSFKDLLDHVRKTNQKYRHARRYKALEIDIAYLRHPFHQIVKILPDDYTEKMADIVEFIETNQRSYSDPVAGFDHIHLIKARRILQWMREPLATEAKDQYRRDFYLFFSEHDRRRNTNFLNTFPEMAEFWEECKKLAESPTSTTVPSI